MSGDDRCERVARPDQEEFYQVLTYKDDIDLEANLDEWKPFYNLSEATWCLQRQDPLTRYSENAYKRRVGSPQRRQSITVLAGEQAS